MARLLFPLMLAAGVAVGGCAGTPDSVAAPARATVATAECERLDCAKISRVNRQARSLGVQVIWINPPQKVPQQATPEGGA